MFTTNEEDLREAEKLQKRLQQQADSDDEDDGDDDYRHNNVAGKKNLTSSSSSGYRIPNVSIDSGAHKYVLISAILPPGEDSGKERQYFVVSRRGAEYHRNVAEPFVECLEQSGYSNIRIMGGGRIALDETRKLISIYGYSYGFGLADHALSQSVVEKDPRYQDYQITWSNDGY